MPRKNEKLFERECHETCDFQKVILVIKMSEAKCFKRLEERHNFMPMLLYFVRVLTTIFFFVLQVEVIPFPIFLFFCRIFLNVPLVL